MFSVIIPTCNRPRFLETAIASALAQETVGLEVIVVDDGDGSGIAAAQALADARITTFDNARRGPVRARNEAIGLASRPYIAFLDDDDWWQDRRHLARAGRRLGDDAAFWFSDGELVVANGPELRLPFAFSADARSLERSNTILISAVAYRRELHHRLGGFDESLPYYWDWDWYLRVARSGAALAHEPTRSAAIRAHGSNMSGPRAGIERRANLDRFAAKHGLPRLDLKNHLSIAVAAMA